MPLYLIFVSVMHILNLSLVLRHFVINSKRNIFPITNRTEKVIFPSRDNTLKERLLLEFRTGCRDKQTPMAETGIETVSDFHLLKELLSCHVSSKSKVIVVKYLVS